MDKRKLKGLQTKQMILSATLEIIADKGIEHVTHRSVAEVAQVNFSLLTYHFKDIKTLLVEAFALYIERSKEDTASVWQEIDQFLSGYPSPQNWSHIQSQQIADFLADYATQYVITQFTTYRKGMIVEQTFLFAPHTSSELNQYAQQHKERLVEELAVFCTKIGSTNPSVDAKLLLEVIQCLSYEGIIDPSDKHIAVIRQQMKRLISLIINDSR